ncbi:MAG: CHRD domain-containing protein [Pseudonocardiaceae bacterium]
MQYKKGVRAIGRVGAALAFASSVLVFAGPASASAAVTTAHEYDDYGYGHDQFSVYLTGDQVRGGGDRDGQGFARLDFDPDHDRVCYAVRWRRLAGDVTAFHLHVSPRRHDGPVVIDFFNHERYNGYGDTVVDCVHSDERTIRDVLRDPSDFYLMLHTTAHDDGAIRGQLY